MAVREVDKLIIKAAREILKPMGLFQKGSSRIWIDDNNWFLIVVEFQPSAWSQGAYLNVDVSFLWEQGKGFVEVLPCNMGGRQRPHIEYQGDDALFFQQMLEMAGCAKAVVESYRTSLTPLAAAQKGMAQYHDANSPMNVMKAWNCGMFQYLYGDEKRGDAQLQTLLVCAEKEREFQSGGKTHTREWVVELMQSAKALLANEAKQQYVTLSIIEKRQRLRQKPSYKKLPISPDFQ